MSAGAKGDHPLNDILIYNLDVYSQECDNLIRDISKLMDTEAMFELLDWFDQDNKKEILKFQKKLSDILIKLKEDRKLRGWE